MKTIPENIKTIRGKLRQKDFGAKIGATQSAVQSWESGESLPGGKYLEAIHREFGVSIDWLLTGQGDPYIKDRARGSPDIELDNKEGDYYKEWVSTISGAKDAGQPVEILHSIEMLAKILGSKNQTLIRAIVSNLQAFSEAVDQKDRLNILEAKLNALVEKVDIVQSENKQLRTEVNRLRATYENPDAALDTEEEAM